MKKIIVTGGLGFIGSNLIDLLIITLSDLEIPLNTQSYILFF